METLHFVRSRPSPISLSHLPTFRLPRLLWIAPVAVGCWAAGNPGATTSDPNSVVAAAGLPEGAWASIRAAYEASRHAALPEGEGHTAKNPQQQWTTQFDGRGFLVQPEGASWRWGLELQQIGSVNFTPSLVERIPVQSEGQRVAYGWNEQVEEWFVNDTRGLEHGLTLRQRPANLSGDLTVTLGVRGDLLPELGSDAHSLRFVNADGKTVVSYSDLQVWDARGQSVPARFEIASASDSDLGAAPRAFRSPESARVRFVIDDQQAQYPLTIDPLAQQAYLKASTPGAGDRFGYSVAVSGDTVVVGANSEDSGTPGVNPAPSNRVAVNSGAAYVFVRSGAGWVQQAMLKASNPRAEDAFGTAVAISGDTLVVGAYLEDSGATGVNGDQLSTSAADSGAAYVFVRQGSTWTQQAYLKASNTESEDSFGASVAISGDLIVVGAPLEDGSGKGVNPPQNSNDSIGAGAAYVFSRTGTTWSQEAYLKASNTGAGDVFGQAVAISGETVLVGAYVEASSATGVNGSQNNNSAINSGAAYVFTRNAGLWSQQAYLKASNTGKGDLFGYSVALSGDTAVVGALAEASNAVGVDGNQKNDAALNAGAAYIFVRTGTTWRQQAYLKPSNTDAGDFFGYSVAVDGDTVVVGSIWEDGSGTGIGGQEQNNYLSAAGAAYIFRRQGATWTQDTYLKASNTKAEDEFGASVAISGTTIVVGAPTQDGGAEADGTGFNPNPISDAGSAYIWGPFPSVPPQLVDPVENELQFSAKILTEPGKTYVFESQVLLGSTQWTEISRARGNGTVQRFVDPKADSGQRFYRARIE